MGLFQDHGMTVDDVGKEIDIEIAVQEVRGDSRQAAQALSHDADG